MEKKNRSGFDENTFYETATKNKSFNIFSGSEFFLLVGSLTDKTGPQPTNSRLNRHNSDHRPTVFPANNRLGLPPTQLPQWTATTLGNMSRRGRPQIM